MTALVTDPVCLEHEMGPRHPERPARLEAVLQHLDETGLLADLASVTAPEATREQIIGVHEGDYVDAIERLAPTEGLVRLDPDTFMGPGSLSAARTAVGAAVAGVDLAFENDEWRVRERRVFCAVRPPGHHAEAATAMGFCIFNGIAVAAVHALASKLVERVAILDFDVHHGNGTVAAFAEDSRVLVCSSFQYPHYPYRLQDVERPNIVNTPLPAHTGSVDYRRALERDWLPAVEAFKPELILASAGFDAHAADPLGDLRLTEDDFAWTADLIVALADSHADGRMVSVLEGGYDLQALARSVHAYVERL
ncbi:MAG: histone deacetylase family protein [Gammaproteobacteria bacterium]|nr:histone deacetylase family protein [Gammaproteobacteria bacterium]